MRGWESVPEWLMRHVDFTYDVEVIYSEDSYTRTGQQLISAGVLPNALMSALPATGPVSLASLNALTITFPRWIPVNWKAAVTGMSGALLPAVTFGKMPSHFRNLKANVKAAEDHVATVPDLRFPHRKRRNSGTLAGAISGLASLPGGMYVLASANQYQASMFQPDPMDPSVQPKATTTPAGSVPAVIPAATVATNLLAGPFSAGAFFTELSKLGPSKGYDVSAKTASSHFKTLRTTLLKPLVGISKGSTKAKAKAKKPKGRMLVKNAAEGHKLVVAILAWKQNNPKQKFNKLALMQAVAASQLPKDTRGLLLQLETDPNLMD
jgi:hypothetical protein